MYVCELKTPCAANSSVPDNEARANNSRTLPLWLCLHKLSVSPGDSSKILIHLKKPRTGRESGQCTLLLMISLSKITHTHTHYKHTHRRKNEQWDAHVSTGRQTGVWAFALRHTHANKNMPVCRLNTHVHKRLIKSVQHFGDTTTSALTFRSVAGKQQQQQQRDVSVLGVLMRDGLGPWFKSSRAGSSQPALIKRTLDCSRARL